MFSVRSTMYKEFPSIRNGTRVLLMSVKQSIPSSLNVLGFVCRVWYPGQPAFCSICRQHGHLPRACPLSGLCRRCKQPGHVVRECPLARGSSQSSSVPPPVPELPSDPDPVSSDPDPVSSDPDPVSVSDVPVVPPDPAPVPVDPEYVDYNAFREKFMASHSVPECYGPSVYQALHVFHRERRPRQWYVFVRSFVRIFVGGGVRFPGVFGVLVYPRLVATLPFFGRMSLQDWVA